MSVCRLVCCERSQSASGVRTIPAKTQLHEFQPTTGSGAVLVLIDTSQPEVAFVLPVLRALEHCGIPFRVVDLSWEQPAASDLQGCAAVVVAQDHSAASLSAAAAARLPDAVEHGLGLVNLDFHLASAPAGLASLVDSTGAFDLDALTEVGISPDEHYITRTHPAGEATRLRVPLAYTVLSCRRPDAEVLLESGSGAPVLIARRVGAGRVVQWTSSMRLWLRQYLGWTQGLDDLFWKSIVWVARKPFLMHAMPPFVRMRFDDCLGYWRAPADFDFAHAFIRRGHRPNLSLNIRAVTPAGAAHIARLHAAGEADFAAHILDAQTSVWFKRGERAYTPSELAPITAEVDAAFERWGIPQSRVLSDHEHEFGSTALPYLRARGIRYKMNINLPDEAAEGLHRDWRPAPYGSMSYALDRQPSSGMFVAFNHFPNFDHNRTYLEDGQSFYQNRTGGVGECKWDFLNGLTRSSRGTTGTDVESAATRLAFHTRRGLDSLFFGGSITHSHFIRDVQPAEWDRLLDRADELLRGYRPRYVSYDHIAEYAESKVNTHLEHVDVQTDGSVCVNLRGRATVPLELSWFRDTPDGPERTFSHIDLVDGRLAVRLQAPA